MDDSLRSETAKDDSNKDVNGTFYFSVKNSNGQYLQVDKKTFNTGEVFFEIMAGDFMEFTDIPVDTYTITEDTATVNVTGYDFLTSGSTTEANASVTKNTTAQADLVNNYRKHLGTLTVSKTAKDDKNADLTGTFEFSVKNSEGKFLQADEKTFDTAEVFFTVDAGSSKVFDNLPVGEYVVTEKTTNISISGYTFDSVNSRTNGSATVTLNGTAEVELINKFTLDLGSLTITKALGTNAPSAAASKTYEFTVTGPNNYSATFELKNGESKTLTDLVLGTYTVTENGTAANGAAQISGYDLVVSGEGNVELTAAEKDKTATVTNAYTQQKGALIVRKTAKDDSNKDITGTVEFSVKNSENQYLQADEKTFGTTEVFFTVDAGTIKEFSDIPVGTYTVTEKTDSISVAGYTFTSTGSTTSVTETVTKGAATEAGLINRFTQDLGSLEITKALGTNAPSAAALKTYTFTVSGPNGYSAIVQIDGAGSETLTDLVPGRYTVTENETDAAISGYDLVVSGGGAVAVVANNVAHIVANRPDF